MCQNVCLKPDLCFNLLHLCIDEQLVKFKGIYAGKVVNPNKPAKVGINAIVMASGISKLTLWYSTKGVEQTNKLYENMN